MKNTDLIIIGAGPGGYETAVKAAKNGMQTVLVEAHEAGGTCLNVGCIPTKCFCRDAERIDEWARAADLGLPAVDARPDFARIVARKNSVVADLRKGVESLLKQPGLTLVRGTARFVGPYAVEVTPTDATGSEADPETYEAGHIIIATGSVPKLLPIEGNSLPGVLTSTELLNIDRVPRHLCIVGGGVIGMEFASVFRSFGSGVTVLEFCREILPNFDSDIAKRLRAALKQRGIATVTQARVERITQSAEDSLTVAYDHRGAAQTIEADCVLMAVGRAPNLATLGLDTAGIAYTDKGIVTDGNMQTNVAGVYAIGDVNGRFQLAHAATFQGRRALNHICRRADGLQLDIMPSAVFTVPELASVGLTAEAADALGFENRTGKASFRANGKAVAMGCTEGLVKLVAGTDGGLMGCHIMGPHAADLIQEITALMRFDATVTDLTEIVHAHPTLGEAVHEAARQLA